MPHTTVYIITDNVSFSLYKYSSSYAVRVSLIWYKQVELTSELKCFE